MCYDKLPVYFSVFPLLTSCVRVRLEVDHSKSVNSAHSDAEKSATFHVFILFKFIPFKIYLATRICMILFYRKLNLCLAAQCAYVCITSYLIVTGDTFEWSMVFFFQNR